MSLTRNDAYQILTEFTKDESLIKHALAVEAAMRHYAELYGEDPERWGVIGLLHDFDYEQWPQPPEHTRKGAEVLKEREVDQEIIDTILSHAEWNLETHPRDTLVRKVLFAVDELCGFLTAVAYVRPNGLTGIEPKSVVKKLKQKAFAAQVSREDIRQGAELLERDLNDHIIETARAMRKISKELGLPE